MLIVLGVALLCGALRATHALLRVVQRVPRSNDDLVFF
jgi:hypothetical protein